MRTIDLVPGATLYRCVKTLAVVGALYLGLRLLGFQRFFPNDAEGVSALLQIIGTLYSVLYAFATYVIWGQFTSVESEIMKEAGALKALALFSNRLKATMHEAIVRAVKIYARAVVETEWKALSRNEEVEKTDKLSFGVISSVTDVTPENDTERLLYERLLEIASQASAHRDERISLSRKRIPRTLLVFVTFTAFLILLLIFLYPFRSTPLGLVSVGITTMLLFFAHFVLTDLDNPFEGTWNIGPEPFDELLTKLR